jgi:hypothetical protein
MNCWNCGLLSLVVPRSNVARQLLTLLDSTRFAKLPMPIPEAVPFEDQET